jgi:hypothetical protein
MFDGGKAVCTYMKEFQRKVSFLSYFSPFLPVYRQCMRCCAHVAAFHSVEASGAVAVWAVVMAIV